MSDVETPRTLSTLHLVQALDQGLALLDSRGVPVPRRALVEGYARCLAAEALDLTGVESDSSLRDAPPSGEREGRVHPGHHARDPNGVRYWIVARRSGDGGRDVVVPGVPRRAFDRILVVRFDTRFDVDFAGAAPATSFLRAAAYREGANEWLLGFSDPFWSAASVENLTILFRIAARRLDMDDTSEDPVAALEAGRRIQLPIREPTTRPKRRNRERTGEAEPSD